MGARPAALRRVAASRGPPARRSRAATRSARDLHDDGGGAVRGAGGARAAGHRGDGAQAHGRDARRAHPAGDADRANGGRRAHELGDRRPAVPEPAHGRVAPAQGVRKARHQLAQGAPLGAAGRPRSRRARIGAFGACESCRAGTGPRAEVSPFVSPSLFKRRCRAKAHRNHNPRVGGSSPSSGMRKACNSAVFSLEGHAEYHSACPPLRKSGFQGDMRRHALVVDRCVPRRVPRASARAESSFTRPPGPQPGKVRCSSGP